MVGFIVAVSFISTLLMYLLCVASGKSKYIRSLEDNDQAIYIEEYNKKKKYNKA